MSKFSEFIAEARAANGWTPDVPLLDTQDEWYVFTYAERRGKSSSYFLTEDMEDCKFVSLGWTKSKLYNILSIEEKNGKVHLANLSGTDQIFGEVWRIPTSALIQLDGDERNQLRSHRMRVPIIVAGGIELLCWIYLVDSKYLVKGGHKTYLYRNYCYVGQQKFLDV